MNNTIATLSPLQGDGPVDNPPGDPGLPVAAIVAISVGLYVVITLLFVVIVRCYCGRQCSNINIKCGGPFLCDCCQPEKGEECFGPTTMKCITCSCIQCDWGNCCQPSKQDFSFISCITCERCLGPNGNFWCDDCKCQCNLDCETINCLCFQVQHGGSTMGTARGTRNSFNNNSSRSGSIEPIKQPPLPSTGRSLQTQDSTRTILSQWDSFRSYDTEVKSTQTPTSLFTASDLPNLSKGTKSNKSAIVPYNDQFFIPRGDLVQNGSAMNGKKKLPPLRTESKPKPKSKKIQTPVESLVSPSPKSIVRFGDVQSEKPPMTSSQMSSATLPPSQPRDRSIQSNPSSHMSLSSTSEALLAQYHIMDASQLSSVQSTHSNM